MSALVGLIICVVIPCDAASLWRFANDPRLGDFLRQAHANHAQFVLGEVDPAWLANLGIVFSKDTSSDALVVYPQDEGIIRFAQRVAQVLGIVNHPIPRD